MSKPKPRLGRAAGLLLLPALLGGAIAGGYSLYLRRARRLSHRPSPESLIRLDTRADEASLHLEGVPNARDLGGYRTMDGQRVRRGMIYRSGTLAEATDRDLERLQALDVRMIFDLREDGEAESAPDRLPAEALYQRLPLTAPVHGLRLITTLVRHLPQMERLVLNSYRDMAFGTGAPRLGQVFRQLATDDAALPALLHCTAGKDRTGLTAALILAVLGVPDDTILADYSLSNRDYPAFFRSVDGQAGALSRIGLRTDDLHFLMLADPAILSLIMAEIRDQYGTIDAYLDECAGVDSAALRQLRRRLLEPDD